MAHDKSGRSVNRRKILKSAPAVAGLGAAAGCTGDGGDSDPTTTDDTDTDTTTATDTPTPTTSSGPETFTNEAGVEVGANFEAVKELAREEGSVNLYAVYDRGPFRNWIDAFRETYPFVSINHVSGGAQTLASRWSAEYQSGNVVASAYMSSAAIQFTWKDGQAMTLDPAWMPVLEDMPEKFKSEDDYWIANDLSFGSIFYNTDMVDADAASGWMDIVTDDRWSDQQLGWDPTPNLYLNYWILQNHGREFFENLHDQRPRFVDSHTDLARLCGAGAFPVAFTYSYKLAEFKELPLFHWEWDPLPGQISPAVINNKAPEPNSAILFLNWLASVEGQEAIAESAYIPYHPDVGYQGYENLYPSDAYDVDIVSPEADLDEMRTVWDETMGDLL